MKARKQINQSVVILLPGVSLGDVGWISHEIRIEEKLDFIVQDVAGFSALLVTQKENSAPALLSARGKRRIGGKGQWVVAVVDVCSQDTATDLHPSSKMAVVYATESATALRTKDVAQLAFANSDRLTTIWLKATERQLRAMLTPQLGLVVVLENAATNVVIQQVLQQTSQARVFVVVTSVQDARRVRDLRIGRVTVFADLPYGKTYPDEVLPYAKLNWYIWRDHMLTGWQKLLWPFIPFWHNRLKVRDLKTAV